MTVPMGLATEVDVTVTGGSGTLELLGRDFAECDLLGLAYDVETIVQVPTAPARTPRQIDLPG